MFILAALCFLAGVLPGPVIDLLAPVVQSLVGARMPVQTFLPWASIVPIAESRSSYNGLIILFFLVVLRHADRHVHPSLRHARDAAQRHLGLRLSRSVDRDAVHQFELRHADPPRVRHHGVPGAREGRHAAAGRDARRAFPRQGVRSGLALRLRPGGARGHADRAASLNQLQFLTIRRYLTLVFATLVILLLVVAAWR